MPPLEGDDFLVVNHCESLRRRQPSSVMWCVIRRGGGIRSWALEKGGGGRDLEVGGGEGCAGVKERDGWRKWVPWEGRKGAARGGRGRGDGRDPGRRGEGRGRGR